MKCFTYLTVAAGILMWIASEYVVAEPAGGQATSRTNAASVPTMDTGKDFDLQGFIMGEIKAGRKKVVVPPGRYRVTPTRGQHLLFCDLSDVEILAEGVEMVCTQTTRAMTFERCRNVRVKGLTIDYNPLPFTQGRIVALAPDKSWLEFEIIDGYPENKLEIRIEIFDPASGLLKRDTYFGWESIVKVSDHRYRATKGKGYRFSAKNDTEEVGDLLVTNNSYAPGGSAGHAIYSNACTNLVLEDVSLYASNCFGFFETNCDGSTYLRCKIDRRGPESDPVRRGWPRMRSLNADAYHSKFAVKGPAILGCVARFQGDDCVNICGDYHMVTACQGKELRVLAKHGMNISIGEAVEILSYDGIRFPDANVVAIKPDGAINDAEKAFLLKQHMHEPFRQAQGGSLHKAYTVTLDREVNLPMGSVIASTMRVGNGFRVEDCDFGFNRSRGILIKASNGTVKNNRLSGNWMSAVLVSPEFWWLEAGSSNNVTVQGNVIKECRTTAIEIVAHGGNGKTAPSGAHRDIVVAQNRIIDCSWPNILVTSTDRLAVTGNICETIRGEPVIKNRSEWKTQSPDAILTINCENPRLENNQKLPDAKSRTADRN